MRNKRAQRDKKIAKLANLDVNDLTIVFDTSHWVALRVIREPLLEKLARLKRRWAERKDEPEFRS